MTIYWKAVEQYFTVVLPTEVVSLELALSGVKEAFLDRSIYVLLYLVKYYLLDTCTSCFPFTMCATQWW